MSKFLVEQKLSSTRAMVRILVAKIVTKTGYAQSQLKNYFAFLVIFQTVLRPQSTSIDNGWLRAQKLNYD